MPPIQSVSKIRPLRSEPLAPKNIRIFTTTERMVGMAASTQELTTSPKFPPPTSPILYYPQQQSVQQLPPQAPMILPSPFTQLQDALSRHLATHPASALSPTLPTLFSLLRDYTSNSADWSAFAHANAAKQYTRNLVCEVPGLFNLLLLVWTPGKQSPVHDHADSHCLMKILKGNLVEKRFAIPHNPGFEGPLTQTSCKNFKRDQVTYMSDSLGLHEISNPSSTEFAVSLHLYTPPNAAIRGCHVYDQTSGEARHVMQGAYDSVAGVVTN